MGNETLNQAPRSTGTIIKTTFVLGMLCVVLAFAQLTMPASAHAADMSYTDLKTNVETLRGYADAWLATDAGKADKALPTSAASKGADNLTAAYIRAGRYNATPDSDEAKAWNVAGGAVSADFVNYVKNQPQAADVAKLQAVDAVELPNHEKIDALHMFATINGVLFDASLPNVPSPQAADLTGWIGDAAQLTVAIKDATGDEQALYDAAKAQFNASDSVFGPEDLRADLDGYNLAKALVASKTLPQVMADYFTDTLDEVARVKAFDESRLSSAAIAQGTCRNAVENAYLGNGYVTAWEAAQGLTPTDDDHRKAVARVLADYLYSFNPQSIRTVTVDPAVFFSQRGDKVSFTAAVQGGFAQDVTWSLVGAHSSATTIDADGKLTIDLDEQAATLTVQAAPKANPGNTGLAVVTVDLSTLVLVNPPRATVAPGKTVQFTATVKASAGVSTAVTWSVEGNKSTSTKIDENGLLSVAADETADAVTVYATSVAEADKKGFAAVVVHESKIVGVVVRPVVETVKPGTTTQYTAEVTPLYDDDDIDLGVTWAVEGATSKETAIDSAGLLTVGKDETAAKLTIRATSKFDTAQVGTAYAVVSTDVEYDSSDTPSSVAGSSAKTASTAPSSSVKTVDDMNVRLVLFAFVVAAFMVVVTWRSAKRS